MNQLDLYELLDGLVTQKQIHAILSTFKEKHPDQIRLSGTKPELIENLKSNVISGIIPYWTPFKLLQDGEENGDQHIYFYRPLTKKTQELCQDFKQLGIDLFGADWERKMLFPKLTKKTDSYEVVDFRETEDGGWVLKVYGFQTYDQKIKVEQYPDQTYAVFWKKVEYRTVLVAHWSMERGKGLLEMRISRDSRPGRLALHLSMLWSKFKTVVRREDFQEWDFRDVCERLLREGENHTDTYFAGCARLTDSLQGGIEYVPYTEHEPLHQARIRVDTIASILDDGGRCARLEVRWLASGSSGRLPQDLTCYIGGQRANELLIPANTSPEGVAYVASQLRHFGR
jgi:hypothetical protein